MVRDGDSMVMYMYVPGCDFVARRIPVGVSV